MKKYRISERMLDGQFIYTLEAGARWKTLVARDRMPMDVYKQCDQI